MKGKITITAVRGRDDAQTDEIRLVMVDAASGVQFLDCRMKAADFAHALLGLGRSPMEFRLEEPELVGKVRETKQECIPVPQAIKADDDALAAHLAQYEVDGWKGRLSDMSNHHRAATNQPGSQHVTFVRFVDVPDREEF